MLIFVRFNLLTVNDNYILKSTFNQNKTKTKNPKKVHNKNIECSHMFKSLSLFSSSSALIVFKLRVTGLCTLQSCLWEIETHDLFFQI